MLAVIRLIIIGIFILISSVLIFTLCLLRPRNPMNVYIAARMYGSLASVLGIKIHITGKENILPDSCVYVANHQSNYDIFILTKAVPPRTVSIGKQSIIYFPFFGLIYWLSGNIFIDRSNRVKAIKSLNKVNYLIREKRISVWLFPEGTRNYGKELKQFKSGAFHLARNAGVPIVPVCISNYYLDFKLNRLSNGVVEIKFLKPIAQDFFVNKSSHQISEYLYNIMSYQITKMSKIDKQ